MSYGGKIALLPGQSYAEEFSTLVDELAHLCCVRKLCCVAASRPATMRLHDATDAT